MFAESTVRNHVRERKRAMGLIQRETFVPQSYALGHEAQVDWYEAWADLGGERTRLQVFAMRSMASGATFHRAYLHATQQAFPALCISCHPLVVHPVIWGRLASCSSTVTGNLDGRATCYRRLTRQAGGACRNGRAAGTAGWRIIGSA